MKTLTEIQKEMDKMFEKEFDPEVCWQGDQWVTDKLRTYLHTRDLAIVEGVKEIVESHKGHYSGEYCRNEILSALTGLTK